jgi:MoxR-like ATPase
VQDRRAPLDIFVGREAELDRVAVVVALVESGQPWLVAIEGDPGVGKTSLARRCLAQARGLRVLSARGDQSETDLDFGLVDQPAEQALHRRRQLLPSRAMLETCGSAGRGQGREGGCTFPVIES